MIDWRWLGVAGALLMAQRAMSGVGVDLPAVSLFDSATVAEQPTPALGEVREFVGPVATINCSHWEIVESEDADALVSQCEHYRIYFKRSANLNIFKVTAANEIAVEFKPYYPGIKFPLQVGKRWRQRYEGYSAIEQVSWSGDVECEVADYADVTIAAGTFRSFRLECKDRWKVGDAESSVNSTAWYSPEVQGVVKSITYEDPRWNTELKAYSR